MLSREKWALSTADLDTHLSSAVEVEVEKQPEPEILPEFMEEDEEEIYSPKSLRELEELMHLKDSQKESEDGVQSSKNGMKELQEIIHNSKQNMKQLEERIKSSKDNMKQLEDKIRSSKDSMKELEELIPYSKAIEVYINGEYMYSPFRIHLPSRKLESMDEVLDVISKKLNFLKGYPVCLYHLTGKLVFSPDELRHHWRYIVGTDTDPEFHEYPYFTE